MKIASGKTKTRLCTPAIIAALVSLSHFNFAATLVWNGADGTSTTTNWSDTANWTPTGTPGSADTAVFGANGTASDALTVNNVVDANTTVSSLRYTNSTSGQWHVTLIPSGTILTASNVTIGGIVADSMVTSVAMTGGGTFLAYGSTFNVGNSGSSGTASSATADFSALSNFVYNVPTGTFNLGNNGARSIGNMTLAGASNSITATNFSFEASASSSSVSATMNLGTGTNIFNVSSNLIGSQRSAGTITFAAGNTTGGVRWRGTSGADSDRANMTLGWRSAGGTSGTSRGRLFFNDHPVDMKFGTLIMGQETASGSPIGAEGNIQFTMGTIDASNVSMAICSGNAGATSTGSFTVGTNATAGVGATLIIGTGGLSLVNQTLGTSTGTLTISGTVNCSGNIYKTTRAGTGNITMTAGTLNVPNGTIGSVTNAIDTLSVQNSTLTVPSGLTASVYATNLTASGANIINVTSVPSFFAYPAQFPVISYVNALGDNTTFAVGTLPGTLQGYISNNVDSLSIDIVITNGPSLAQLKSIKWNGSPTGDWTTNTSVLNWLTNTTPANYNQGDTVTFDDSLTGTTNVNLTMALSPTELNVNNSLSNYIFTGTGKITGDAGLTKTGTGTLIIDNSGTNDFAGGVSIGAGGTVQVGNNDVNGNLPAGNWDDEGTLAFSRSDNITIPTVITGAGSLVQNGNGTLFLNNVAETYSGNTVISKGTLALTGSASIANTAGIYPRGGAFDVSAATASLALNLVGSANGGNLVVGTNNISVNALSTTNSTITLAANSAAPSIATTALTAGGTTNYINITRVYGVDPSTAPPIVIPIINYNSATFVGGFNFGETNFPNAYVTNDTVNNQIDLVLTASPYSVSWNGGSLSDNNWSDAANWNGVAIFPNDNLTFDLSTRLTPFNDTAAGTTYSNITFTGNAGAYTLTGNPVGFNGSMANNSVNPQTVDIALNFSGNASLNGTVAPLIIGGGITNVGTSGSSLTLMGAGIITNLFGSTGATNALVENDFNGNWTLLDNATSATSSVPLAIEINSGTFNFGSASSAPNFVTTSPQGVPQDNQLGANGGTAVLNMSNGVFTTSARLNTGAGTTSVSGTINQYGGLINIASQFQGANGSANATSSVNLYGGTMNIGVSPSGTNFGTFFVASRGNSSLTITNGALLNCGTLDVSRSINSSINGTVNLNGGTIVASSVTTASSSSGSGTTGSTATFNFNGGVLKARGSSATFFQGHITAPIVPVDAYVQTGGAIIDSSTNNITFLEPLLTDPNLAGAPDGGLTKLGTGTLTLAGTNTYIGNTTVSAGTLLVNGQEGNTLVTVASGGTLGGIGTIASNVIVNVGGTIAPGTTNIGTLTVGGNVTIAGTATFGINKGLGTSDQLATTNVGPTTITYGGTLNIVVTNGSLALNDSFQLFSANNYHGSFSAITPATPGAGLAWNTNNLNVNGTLSVIAGAAGPTTNVTITTVTLSGTNMLIHGTNNNVPNNSGSYVVFGSTNLSLPLSSWTPLSTNTYNSTGTLDYTNPIVPGTARQFLIIQATQ